MKVITQQAVGVGIGNGLNIFGIQRQEIRIVPLLKEDILAVVTPVEDMVIAAILKRLGFGHRLAPMA